MQFLRCPSLSASENWAGDSKPNDFSEVPGEIVLEIFPEMAYTIGWPIAPRRVGVVRNVASEQRTRLRD